MFQAFFPEMCLQCRKQAVGASSRLVQDFCGHKKCRVCLLQDEEICKQCANSSNSTFIRTESEQNADLKKSPSSVLKSGGFRLDSNSVIHSNGRAQLNIEKSEEGEKGTDLLCNGTNGDKTPVSDNDFNAHIKSADSNSLKCRLNGDSLAEVAEENPFKIIKIEKNRKQGKPKKKRTYNSLIVPDHIRQLEDSLLYHCNVCNKSFRTKSHVKYHISCFNGLKPHKCSVCNKDFVLKAQLELHMAKHNNIKPYSCNICQRLFSEQSKLKRHIRLHSTEQPHVCAECGKAFRSKESLRTHSLIHKGVKPHSCKFCSAKFTDSSNLKKHLLSHSKEKAHMCDQCGKRFKLKRALSVHRKSHLKIRPYECSTCLKNFLHSKDLQRHSLVHADTKGYTCSICRASFRRKDNLNRHMKNTHPGKTGEVITNVVKSPELPSKKPIIDNPNAINVITASPAFTKSKVVEVAQPVKSTDSRPGTVINGPIKLAFKTPAFKSVYNINRNFSYIPPPQIQKPFDLAESVDICKKILLPDSSSLTPAEKKIDETVITSAEICQQILTPNSKMSEPITTEICQKILFSSSVPAIHYETSFQSKKHAMIKNIKFKVPIQYTNNFKHNTSASNEIRPIEPESAHEDLPVVSVVNTDVSDNLNSTTKVYTEQKPVTTSLATSVIVNNSSTNNINQTGGDIHWRRKTLQNLCLNN